MLVGSIIFLLPHGGRSLLRCCSLSTSSICHLDQYWRKARGLPENPNASGPLTDGPDYSYPNGKIVPLGVGQRNRVMKQRMYVKDMITLSKEMDFAIARHQGMLQQQQAERDRIINSKFKPKDKFILDDE